jgi:UDP-N-acetylmuramate dehydrogenase
VKIFKDFDFKAYNTFGLEVRTKYWLEVADEDDLPRAIETADELSGGQFMFLGGGSNVLFCGNYPGALIRLAFGGIQHSVLDHGQILVEAGAGVSWHELVRYTVERGWWGLENLALIPGSVGAAPIQNIGAYGVEQGDVFESLRGVPLNGPPSEYMKDQCAFAYRNSVFKQQMKGKMVITRVRYRLNTEPHPQLAYKELKAFFDPTGQDDGRGLKPDQIADKVAEIRRAKLPDPAVLGNAGSFFKNPVLHGDDADTFRSNFPNAPLFEVIGEDRNWKASAAWLIEQCGWKGHRRGSVGVSPGHALVLVHYGGGHGQDLWTLAQDIMRSVHDEFGVALEPEVNIINP